MSVEVLCCLFNLKKEEASLAQDLVFSKRSIKWKGHLILDKGLKELVSLDRTVTKNKIINPGNKTVRQSSLLCFQFEKQRGRAFSFQSAADPMKRAFDTYSHWHQNQLSISSEFKESQLGIVMCFFRIVYFQTYFCVIQSDAQTGGTG